MSKVQWKAEAAHTLPLARPTLTFTGHGTGERGARVAFREPSIQICILSLPLLAEMLHFLDVFLFGIDEYVL